MNHPYKTFTYKSHLVELYGYDEDEDGVPQTVEIFIDGMKTQVGNGPLIETIKQWIDKHLAS